MAQSLNTLIKLAANKYLGPSYDGPQDLSSLMKACAVQRLGASEESGFNRLVVKALNDYSGSGAKSFNKSVVDACKAYDVTGRSFNTLVHNALVKFIQTPDAPTYSEFEAHITALAADGERPWDGSALSTLGNKAYTTIAGAEVGSMAGTPWGPADIYGGSFHATSIVCRVVQHAMPDYPAFQALVGTKLFFRLVDTGVNGVVNSVERNNFISTTGTSTNRRLKMSELIYWDGTRAQRMQPSLGLGPEPYDWT